MRILLIAVVLFAVIHFIRIDLAEGTIPKASFNQEKQITCKDETFSIRVTSIKGDTVESLLALYPDPETSFVERLTQFYALNPHLQKQEIVEGDKILLPLSHLHENNCVEST